MSFEQANQALAEFSAAHEGYREAVENESIRVAEKQLADAQLGTASAERQLADDAAEAALTALLAALKDVGIEPAIS